RRALSSNCCPASAILGSGLTRAASPRRTRMAALWAVQLTYSTAARKRSLWIARNSLAGRFSRRKSSSAGSMRFRKASISTGRVRPTKSSNLATAEVFPRTAYISSSAIKEKRTRAKVRIIAIASAAFQHSIARDYYPVTLERTDWQFQEPADKRAKLRRYNDRLP